MVYDEVAPILRIVLISAFKIVVSANCCLLPIDLQDQLIMFCVGGSRIFF